MNSPASQNIEVLFNSVEMELIRRQAVGEVPAAFAGRPADHLRLTVKGWWQLYHESTAIVKSQNRKVWQRNQNLPAHSLDTTALIDGLKTIYNLISLEAIETFRTLEKGEQSAVTLLLVIAHYYSQLTKPTPSYGN